jgi:hypothetical protein
LKLHDEREVEAGLNEVDGEEADGEEDEGEVRPKKRRRGRRMGRDWKCEVEGCGKGFKSVSIYYLFIASLADLVIVVHKTRVTGT